MSRANVSIRIITRHYSENLLTVHEGRQTGVVGRADEGQDGSAGVDGGALSVLVRESEQGRAAGAAGLLEHRDAVITRARVNLYDTQWMGE